jgi:hypothetical protein
MNRNSRLPFCLKRAACFSAMLCVCALLPAWAAPPDARKIMENVYQQNASPATYMRAAFQVFDKEGHSKKKEFSYRKLGTPEGSKTLVVFTAPEEVRGVALLSLNQSGAAVRQYMYIPATERVRSVVAQERSARFIGTDFTFEDIAGPVLDDFSYRLLAENESIDGHKTYKIEAIPVDPSRSQYRFIYYWVAQDAPVILHAELYDTQGREVRVLHASQLKRVAGVWGARRTEMSSLLDGTRTVLVIDDFKLNVQMDEKLFTPQGLEALQGAVSEK